MAREGKLGNCNFFQEEEDEEQDEETLSLSDLPISLIEEDNIKSQVDEESLPLIKSEEDFDFRPRSRKSEMCAADDVFFQGQILPLRHSIGSDGSLTKFKPENLNPGHWVSRSQSLDHYGSLPEFTSFDSRRSSTSSSSTTTARNPKPRVRNQFHAHPSPKPQIRVSTTPRITNRTRKAPVWEFCRVGVVGIPGMELQDLKVRSSISRNSSSESSNNSTCSINKRDKIRSSTGHSEQRTNTEEQRTPRKHMFFDRERLLSGCSCSVGSAVKPVPHSMVATKSDSDGNNDNINGSARESKESMEKRLQELKKKKKRKKKKKLTMEKQQGKRVTSSSNN